MFETHQAGPLLFYVIPLISSHRYTPLLLKACNRHLQNSSTVATAANLEETCILTQLTEMIESSVNSGGEREELLFIEATDESQGWTSPSFSGEGGGRGSFLKGEAHSLLDTTNIQHPTSSYQYISPHQHGISGSSSTPGITPYSFTTSPTDRLYRLDLEKLHF
jgi:hypothetical protein